MGPKPRRSIAATTADGTPKACYSTWIEACIHCLLCSGKQRELADKMGLLDMSVAS